MSENEVIKSYDPTQWWCAGADDMLFKERYSAEGGLRGKVVKVSCDSGLVRVTKDLAQSISSIWHFWSDMDFYGYDLLDPHKEVWRYSPKLLRGLFKDDYQKALNKLEEEVDLLWEKKRIIINKEDLESYFKYR